MTLIDALKHRLCRGIPGNDSLDGFLYVHCPACSELHRIGLRELIKLMEDGGMKLLSPKEFQKAMKEGVEASDVVDSIVIDTLEKAKKDNHLNPDGTFKGGFKGCVAAQKEKGLSDESAHKLCAYIGRRAGKIP
jgi:hypothetical protein